MNVWRHAFANPWAIWLLLAMPALGIVTFLALRRRRWVLARFGRLPALSALTEGGRQWPSLRAFCRSTGLTLLVLGIAGPQWGREPQLAAAPGRDLIVLLDLSRSMLADDVPPNRLTRAKQALTDLADTLQKRGGHRLALVVFAARAKVACPLTNDYDHFREKVADIDPAYLSPDLGPGAGAPSGTRIGAGLLEAVKVHDDRYPEQQDILMISDGDDPAGDDEWRMGIEAARLAGLRVYAMGLGDPVQGAAIPDLDGRPLKYEGKPVVSRLEEKPLQEIARQTGGSYFAVQLGEPRLGELFRERIEPQGGRDLDEDRLPQYRQRYPWFFATALGFLILELILGRRRKIRKKPLTETPSADRPPMPKARRQPVESRT
jgi:Ca-activated chloride channel family protein